MAALRTTNAEEALGQYAAPEEIAKLTLDEVGQHAIAIGAFDIGEEGLEMTLEHLIEDGGLGPPALIVE